VVSKRVFTYVDHAIWKALWRWAKRRHPKKTSQWVMDKYFGTHSNYKWAFFGEKLNENGKKQIVWLKRASTIPIKRHTRIRVKANPYDPDWEIYFEVRLGMKMADDLRGRRKLRYLWMEQNGICPVCNQKITRITGWHNHHIVYRVMGGHDGVENRILLHPTCHNKVHNQRLTVTKPRSRKGALAKA
jgi:RNA-directed DNA polymerase